MKVELDVTEVDDNLAKLLRKLPEATIKAMTKASLLVEEEAKNNCPVDTGTLRSSINHEVVREGEDIAGYVYTNEEYAVHVHFGTGIYAGSGGSGRSWKFKDRKGVWHQTVGQEAKPFLQDAINSKQGEIKAELKKVLDYV